MGLRRSSAGTAASGRARRRPPGAWIAGAALAGPGAECLLWVFGDRLFLRIMLGVLPGARRLRELRVTSDREEMKPPEIVDRATRPAPEDEVDPSS